MMNPILNKKSHDLVVVQSVHSLTGNELQEKWFFDNTFSFSPLKTHKTVGDLRSRGVVAPH